MPALQDSQQHKSINQEEPRLSHATYRHDHGYRRDWPHSA